VIGQQERYRASKISCSNQGWQATAKETGFCQVPVSATLNFDVCIFTQNNAILFVFILICCQFLCNKVATVSQMVNFAL